MTVYALAHDVIWRCRFGSGNTMTRDEERRWQEVHDEAERTIAQAASRNGTVRK